MTSRFYGTLVDLATKSAEMRLGTVNKKRADWHILEDQYILGGNEGKLLPFGGKLTTLSNQPKNLASGENPSLFLQRQNRPDLMLIRFLDILLLRLGSYRTRACRIFRHTSKNRG